MDKGGTHGSFWGKHVLYGSISPLFVPFVLLEPLSRPELVSMLSFFYLLYK